MRLNEIISFKLRNSDLIFENVQIILNAFEQNTIQLHSCLFFLLYEANSSISLVFKIFSIDIIFFNISYLTDNSYSIVKAEAPSLLIIFEDFNL